MNIYDWDGYTYSYVAKFIVDIDNGYVGNIIIPGSILNLYGWTTCKLKFLKF